MLSVSRRDPPRVLDPGRTPGDAAATADFEASRTLQQAFTAQAFANRGEATSVTLCTSTRRPHGCFRSKQARHQVRVSELDSRVKRSPLTHAPVSVPAWLLGSLQLGGSIRGSPSPTDHQPHVFTAGVRR